MEKGLERVRDATGRPVRRLWLPRDREGAWAGRGTEDRGPGMESMDPDQGQSSHPGIKGAEAARSSWDWIRKSFRSQFRIQCFILQELGSHQRHFYFIFFIKEL